jgi:hypothetical protein
MANTYLGQMGSARIYNSSWVDQSGSDGGNVSDWTIGDQFIWVVQVWQGAACNKAISSSQYKLQFERSDNPTVWTDVGASTEIQYASGLLTDDSASGTRRLTSDPSVGECASGFGTAWENDGDNTLNDAGTIAPATELHHEFQWALDTDNAVAGKTYNFRVYCITDSSVLSGTPGASLTIAGGNILPLIQYYNNHMRA